MVISVNILFMVALFSTIFLTPLCLLSSFLFYPQLESPQKDKAIMDDLTTVFYEGGRKHLIKGGERRILGGRR